MSKRNIIIGVGIVMLAIGWYAFRPELIFINKTVNEEFPGGTAMASIEKGPMSIIKGNFKSLAHETKGLASIRDRRRRSAAHAARLSVSSLVARRIATSRSHRAGIARSVVDSYWGFSNDLQDVAILEVSS